MGEQWKQWLTIFLGSKITADGYYSREIKRCLLLGRKVMTNLYSILKSRDITLSTKVLLVKAMVFPLVMAPPPCMTQQYRLASMAAWLSSKGISHWDLLPHIPSIHLSTVNSSPLPGIAPQSLNSSSQPLCCLGYVWLQQGLSDSHSI